MDHIEVILSNSICKNGKSIGGRHEIHKISYLCSLQHIIATIDSIIKNNLLYSWQDEVLDSVEVYCNEKDIVDEISAYYKNNSEKVKVYVYFFKV